VRRLLSLELMCRVRHACLGGPPAATLTYMSDERRIFNDAPMLPLDDFVYVREWHAVGCPALKRSDGIAE
jgi:hypothetical protein